MYLWHCQKSASLYHDQGEALLKSPTKEEVVQEYFMLLLAAKRVPARGQPHLLPLPCGWLGSNWYHRLSLKADSPESWCITLRTRHLVLPPPPSILKEYAESFVLLLKECNDLIQSCLSNLPQAFLARQTDTLTTVMRSSSSALDLNFPQPCLYRTWNPRLHDSSFRCATDILDSILFLVFLSFTLLLLLWNDSMSRSMGLYLLGCTE